MDATFGSTVQQLKQNIYKFSGAKAYQELALMNSHLVDENGKIRTYSDFKRKVDVVHQNYNQNHLQAEYQTAKRSAQASRQWKDIESNQDLFPNLKYMTVGDDRVRHDHALLQGIIKPVSDAFWNTHYPPNGWRCRCYVKPTSEGSTTEKVTIQPDPGFSLNVGKTNKIFDENNHPYFVYPAGDKKAVQKAFENFKLTSSYGNARYEATNGAKVFVSPFADKIDLFINYRNAIRLADAGHDVKIRPHIDSNILKASKNPEYFILNRNADLKSVTTINAVNSALASAQNQGAIAVLNVTAIKDFKHFDLYRKIKGLITEKRKKKLEYLIIIKGNNVVKISRKQILNNVFFDEIKSL